jgi:hypothetical protein
MSAGSTDPHVVLPVVRAQVAAVEIGKSGHQKQVRLPAGRADSACLQGPTGARVAHKAGTHPCSSHSRVDPAPARGEQLVAWPTAAHHGFSVLTDQSL